MDLTQFAQTRLSKLPPWLAARLERILNRIPSVRGKLESEYEAVLGGLEETVKPYREEGLSFASLPGESCDRQSILGEMERLQNLEGPRWEEGFVSGAVYHGEQEHIRFLNQVYALHSQTNPLHADIWPSIAKYEAEIVSMTSRMLGAEPGSGVCGTVSSGGTESILLAVKAYRDWARETKGIRRPELIAPVSAHAAFEKAAQYFNVKLVLTPLDASFRADVSAVRKALNRNTIAIAGSAPSFPHGVIDPIEELAELAREQGVGFHVDACLGGFILPWAEKLGYPVPPFDFRLPGVTSMSADTHKYGYAPKGSSVVLYRDPELRRFQYFAASDWPGGLYFSPTFAGSRPGALSAACWAAMVTTGESGYREAARKILSTAAQIKTGIANIPGLQVLGDPLYVIAFTSREFDIYRVLDFLSARKWVLNGLHRPAAVHLCVTLRHTQPGVAGRFLVDLKDAVDYVRANPGEGAGMAPVYGLAGSIPMRGMVRELLKRFIDLLYKVE